MLDLINIYKTGLKKELIAKATYSAQKRQTYRNYVYMENELCDIGVSSALNVIDIAKYHLNKKNKG